MNNEEMVHLLKQSFKAHMDYVIPKIREGAKRLDSEAASKTVSQFLNLGVLNPEDMSHPDFWTEYGGKVKSTYEEIYQNAQKRFVEGRGTEYAVERVL
jgi:hypothetical protein